MELKKYKLGELLDVKRGASLALRFSSINSTIMKSKIQIMAQSAVTVRIDSEMKSQFDELCNKFGMSINTAFNIFVNAVVRSRSIPFTIKDDRVEQPSALDLFMKQRKAAESSHEPEMTLEEINAEIRAAREEKYGR